MKASADASTRQTANHVLMIRPAAFASNAATRPTNSFQAANSNGNPALIAKTAVAEFNSVVAALVARGVGVELFEGNTATELPDEVFPNNWFSTHDDGTVVLYPMFAWNRRPERRRDILDMLQQRADGFRIERIVDLSVLERRQHYLEGTGSLVLDRINRVAYACRSPRTHEEALRVFAHKMDYSAVLFDAADRGGQRIFHTNVLMSMGAEFVLICLEAIAEPQERFRILRRLEQTGRTVIQISLAQMHAFTANILELRGSSGNLIVMSARAAKALSPDQAAALGQFGDIVPLSVGTIEQFGGGGVRCMLAEIFLARKQGR